MLENLKLLTLPTKWLNKLKLTGKKGAHISYIMFTHISASVNQKEYLLIDNNITEHGLTFFISIYN